MVWRWPHSIGFVARVIFPVGALVCVAVAVVAGVFLATGQVPETIVLPLGLPDLPFHTRLDPLSAFFLLVLGLAGTGISTFAAGYFRSGEGTAPALLGLHYHVFLAAMAMVILADDAYLFMVAWETMALSSYFLVTSHHRIPEIRSAGFLYLVMAHIGAICILLSFGVLQGGSWHFTFDAMRGASLTPFLATTAFLLALLGFGAKAGLVPMHVWLPEAHPAAPSPVSAMMSGLMLKTAIYGILRISFDLLHLKLWWWGVLMLVMGLFSAMFGAIFAAVQSDMKRLLAYSSIENIGLIFTGIGLSIVFETHNLHLYAALALTAALVHALNHAFFKSLLFLVTGSVLHATKTRNLGKLGGLIRRMPWVAALALVGTLSILGQPREADLVNAHDANWLERLGLGWLALGCILIGVLPQFAIGAAGAVTHHLLNQAVRPGSTMWWIAPIAPEQASYSGLILLAGIVAVVGVTFVLVRILAHGRIRRTAPWDCGYPWQTPRMQDTAEGFGQPIRHMFDVFFRIERHLPAPDDAAPRYRVAIEDWIWRGVYRPIARSVQWLADVISVLQGGRLAIYLLYSFLTLLGLLVFVL